MINELIAFSSCSMLLAYVSVRINLLLRKNRYKRENDKENCHISVKNWHDIGFSYDLP